MSEIKILFFGPKLLGQPKNIKYNTHPNTVVAQFVPCNYPRSETKETFSYFPAEFYPSRSFSRDYFIQNHFKVGDVDLAKILQIRILVRNNDFLFWLHISVRLFCSYITPR